jgi:hypothetical protein
MLTYEDIILEMARTEREALEAVRRKIAARQLGEAWKGLEDVEAVSTRRRAA